MNMKKLMTSFLLTTAVGSFIGLTALPAAKAEESTVNHAKDKAEDASTDTKVGLRNGKQKMRKIIGTDNAAKDAKDSVNNVKDKSTNLKDKVERKTENN